MHKWTDIRRRILVNGETKRSVQRLYGIHWQTLNKILSHADMPGYRMAKKRPRVKLAPFIDVIRSWLEADKAVNKKQRHTGKRVFDRLRKECGYQGGYTVIKFPRNAMRSSGSSLRNPARPEAQAAGSLHAADTSARRSPG
jgi:hypothetical protein